MEGKGESRQNTGPTHLPTRSNIPFFLSVTYKIMQMYPKLIAAALTVRKQETMPIIGEEPARKQWPTERWSLMPMELSRPASNLEATSTPSTIK